MTDVSMDPEDLLALDRRGQLSEAQRRALQRELERSEELRLLRDAGRFFDGEGPSEAGDDELCSRLAENVLVQKPKRNQGGKARRAAWVAVWVFGASSAAAASWTYTVQNMPPNQGSVAIEESSPAQKLPVARSVSREEAPSPQVTEATLERGRALRVEPSGDSQARGSTQMHSPSSQGAAAEASKEGTAAALTARQVYEQANQLRRQGKAAQALSRYRELELQFPSSSESQAARLTVAELLLRQGRHLEALKKFEDYRGPLVAEALWGQARAQRASARSPERERRVLLELIQRFPTGAYAPAARLRLQELSR